MVRELIRSLEEAQDQEQMHISGSLTEAAARIDRSAVTGRRREGLASDKPPYR